jgi:hypothetical protein
MGVLSYVPTGKAVPQTAVALRRRDLRNRRKWEAEAAKMLQVGRQDTNQEIIVKRIMRQAYLGKEEATVVVRWAAISIGLDPMV